MKLVKFNLLLDNKRCRTIEDIKENFNLVDILEQYQSGKLKKWLKVRKCDDYYDELESLDQNTTLLEVSKVLCNQFDIEFIEQDIQSEIDIYENIHDIKEKKEVCKETIRKLMSENQKLKDNFKILSQKNSKLKKYIKTNIIEMQSFDIGGMTKIEIIEYIKHYNKENSDSLSKWRLPTIAELKHIKKGKDQNFYWVYTDEEEIAQYDPLGKRRKQFALKAKGILVKHDIELERLINE